MQTDSATALCQSFREVIEQLAFMFAEPAELDEMPPKVGDCMETHMSFRGAFAGQLSLVVPATIGREIAANILGLDPDDPRADEKGADALKEVLNVTCGQVLTRLAGTDPIFELSVPTLTPLGSRAWPELLAAGEAQGFLIDETPALLTLDLEENAA